MNFFYLPKKILVMIGRPVYIIIKSVVKSLRHLKIRGWIRWSYLFGSIALLGMTAGTIWIYKNIIYDLPNVNEIYNPPRLSTMILDRNGVLLYKFYENEDRSWITIDKIPNSLIQATVAIEDKDFYNHHGISVKGIFNALEYNFLKKGSEDKLRGGSTITQQLVKSVFFSNEKTFTRKIKEAVLAVLIENKLTKEEILERYFNQVSYGGETYGVEAAANKYFGKKVEEITMAEATYLAGLPAAPSSYSPFGANPELGYLRQKHVIEEMVSAKFIDKETANKLKLEKINIVRNKTTMLAPHFVFYVKSFLEDKLGYQNFGRRGLVIRTSLDIKTQQMVENIVADEVSKVGKLKISNGAALVVEPKTGQILAMVGSKDYNAKDIDGKYNVTTAWRQPGSSIKPINYLLALKMGWSLASVIDDEPVVYQIKGQKKPYAPQNYNGKYMGRVTLRTALASSLNIPSVKILAQDGVSEMIDLAEIMGITTWSDRSRFGLSLALGSAEVKMTEMANAYSIFANLGDKTEIEPILEIRNYLGEKIYTVSNTATKVADPGMAFLINDTLSDNQARSPIFGLNSKLKIENKTVAVKTGTTNSLRDNWCIGWTPSILVAAWVGNNDNTPMSWVASGVSGATPIWSRIMTELLINKVDEKWPVPNGVYKANVCGNEEYFIEGTEKNIKCNQTPTPTPINL